MKKYLTVNINIEFEIPRELDTNNEQDFEDFVHNIELPHNYVSDTMEILNITDSNNIIKYL